MFLLSCAEPCHKVETEKGETSYIFCDCIFYCDRSSISVFRVPELGNASISKLTTFVMEFICIFKCVQLTKIYKVLFL